MEIDPVPESEQRAGEVGKRLHQIAEQMSFEAEQLDDEASAKHAESKAIQADAGQMREMSEDLHRQADLASEASDE